VSSALFSALDNDIRLAHERFLSAMEGRLPDMHPETKERYFVVLSSLVAKLEIPEKGLHDILQEMMSEVAGYLFAEMGRRT
jgi:hypothetical protein